MIFWKLSGHIPNELKYKGVVPMASTLRLDFLQGEKEYAGMSNVKIAQNLAQKYGYIAVIQFEDMGTYFACCRTVEETEEVLGSSNCKNKKALYRIDALKDAFISLQARGILELADTKSSNAKKKWWRFWKA